MLLAAAASVVLGLALLVPFRDDRAGKRASVPGRGRPFIAAFLKFGKATDDARSREAPAHGAAPVASEPVAPAVPEDVPAFAAALAAHVLPSACVETVENVVRPDERFAPPPERGQERGTFRAPAASVAPLAFPPGLDRFTLDPLPSIDGLDGSAQTTAALDDPYGADDAAAHASADERLSPPPDEAIDVAAKAEPASGRAVPLTRRPLRRVSAVRSWPVDLGCPDDLADVEREQLLAELERAAPSEHLAATLLHAYAQENAPLRLAALRALRRHPHRLAAAAFLEAARVGTDEERFAAIDGLAPLAASGNGAARDALVEMLFDRLDGVAAKAALAVARIDGRAAVEALLNGRGDASRRDVVLALLACASP